LELLKATAQKFPSYLESYLETKTSEFSKNSEVWIAEFGEDVPKGQVGLSTTLWV
jgi:hypothetical protein